MTTPNIPTADADRMMRDARRSTDAPVSARAQDAVVANAQGRIRREVHADTRRGVAEALSMPGVGQVVLGLPVPGAIKDGMPAWATATGAGDQPED